MQSDADLQPDPSLDTLDRTDFALDEMPGEALHTILRGYRERGPVQPTRFLGLPAFVISQHDALEAAFQDEFAFPGHRMYAASFAPVIGESFISEPDPARHLTLRKLTTPAFRSRAITRYEEKGLVELAHELVDEIAPRLDRGEEVDLVASFTARFPYLVISRMLGLGREREDEFHDWALALLRFRDDPDRAREASIALSAFLAPIVEARRAEPRDDVISGLIAASVDGRRMTDEEIFSHVRLLFPTGGETTHGSLGNLLHALLTHQSEWDRLRRSPERIDAAVAEGLRWETPIAVLPRMSRSEPIEFRGTKIPADSWVLFAIAAANRDPALVEHPDRFDPTRSQPPNLVFGRGPKSCPGLHLARKNMAVALEVVIERIPEIELVDPAASRPRATVLRCPPALRVRKT